MRLLFMLLRMMVSGGLHGDGAEIYGEALYWRPTYDGVGYAVEDDRLLFITPNNDWGFTVGGRYFYCDGKFFTAGDYTYFRSHAQLDNVSLRSRYRHADWEGGFAFVKQPCVQAYFIGSIRYFKITEQECIDEFRQCYSTMGVGPRIGLSGQWTPFPARKYACGLGLRGHLATVAAFGDRRLHTSVISVPARNVITPGIDAKAGLFYRHSCTKFWITGECGYELNTYFNARDRFESGIKQTSSIGYGGLFLNLSVGI